MFYLEHFGVTDAGKVRENNEDSLLVGGGKDETLFAVADGIGGFEAGEIASRMAVEALRKMEPDDSFDGVIREANRRIRAAAKGDERLSGMGTTVVAIRFGGTQRRPVAEVAHVGDSRAYLLRGERLRPITEDHSLVAELVRSGDLTRDEAAEHPQKNLITRALGAEENVAADTAVLPVEAGDRIMLCSDGLSDMVGEERIREVLVGHPQDPEEPAEKLLSEALDAGGNDNVTVVVIDVREQREATADGRSGETHEMPAVGSAGGADGGSASAFPAETAGRRKRVRRAGSDAPYRKRSALSRNTPRGERRRGRRSFGRVVRGLAILAVVAVALSPVYLWGSTRYFLDSADGGKVVAYRGLPLTVAGVSLNKPWRTTNIGLDQVNVSARASVRDNTLYTREEINRVLTQMQRDTRNAERSADRRSGAQSHRQSSGGTSRP